MNRCVLLCGCLFFKGDINKKQKGIQKLERQIKAIQIDKVRKIVQKNDLTVLHEDIQKITTNIQVGPEPAPSRRTPYPVHTDQKAHVNLFTSVVNLRLNDQTVFLLVAR